MTTNYLTINGFDFKSELLQELKEKSVLSKKEICGFIVGGEFRNAENIHPDPEKYFLISPKDYVFGENVILFHSHPEHADIVGFSNWDLENQYYFQLDMLLYSVKNNEFYFKKT